MELRDLLCVDVESLSTMSAIQAELVSRDAIDVLTKGGLSGIDQQRIKSLMLAANQRVLTQSGKPGIREEIKQRIADAEKRGEKLAARCLAQGMLKSDADALDRETRGQALIEAANKFMADDIAARKAAKEQQIQEMINIRTQELVYSHGWTRTEDECREQATREIKGSSMDDE